MGEGVVVVFALLALAPFLTVEHRVVDNTAGQARLAEVIVIVKRHHAHFRVGLHILNVRLYDWAISFDQSHFISLVRDDVVDSLRDCGNGCPARAGLGPLFGGCGLCRHGRETARQDDCEREAKPRAHGSPASRIAVIWVALFLKGSRSSSDRPKPLIALCSINQLTAPVQSGESVIITRNLWPWLPVLSLARISSNHKSAREGWARSIAPAIPGSAGTSP